VSDVRRVLVTGATGKLGRATCEALLALGFEVRATDQKQPSAFPVEVELGDLKDEFFVHRLVRGVQAVVHLGNHPNAFVGPSPQRLLSENVTMNANVFYSSVQHDVRRLVFASSVQTFLYTDFEHRKDPPLRLPYLPLDGRAPRAPGNNAYAQSKEAAERLLEHLVEAHPGLSATALRYPMLVGDRFFSRFETCRSLAQGWFNFSECLSHLTFEDAGQLAARVVALDAPGYHQYFPAQTMQLGPRRASDLISEFYSETRLVRPLAEIDELIDLSDIERETGWRPTRRIVVPLED
jgi:nucleoside-diphosphate-sugar epimerase